MHITTVDSSLRYLLLNQLLYLQRQGYRIAAISSPGPDARRITAEGIYHLPISMTRRVSPWSDLVALAQLVRVLREGRFTIVHSHTPKAGLLGQVAARIAGIPVVIHTLHGRYYHDGMGRAQRQLQFSLERLTARCSDLILSQSTEDVETCVREGICPANKITHLGNGINLADFDRSCIADDRLRQLCQDLRIPSNAKVIGFVGRLAAKRKGFVDFLAAGRHIIMNDPEVVLLIVGAADHGKPDAVAPSVAVDYGIAPNCRFVGQRPNLELPQFYALMKVLVLPSLFEGVPRVVMEASAMGVPAVVTDVKGNREAVRHGYNGLLVPLGDVPSLIQAIRSIVENPERARFLGENGRRMAGERFDERHVFRRVESAYARILAAKGLCVPQPVAAT